LESSSCFLPSAGIDPCNKLIQLSPSSCGGGFLVIGGGRMIGSMWRPTERRQFIEKHLGQRGRRTGPGVGWVDRPRPILAQFGPGFSTVASCVIPYLCVLACGSLTLFPSWLRLETLLSKLRCFVVESLKTCTLTLRSSGHLESCSSRVLG
jgi:hypothetical protein